MDELARGRWPNGGTFRLALCLPRGRAEPAPPRGGQLQRRSPTGERPEMTREVVFSEGRGLRARVVRPETSRGTSILWTSRREAGGRRERAIRLALCRHRGRAEPAPPRNRDPDKGNQRLQRRDASVERDADIMRAGGRSASRGADCPVEKTGCQRADSAFGKVLLQKGGHMKERPARRSPVHLPPKGFGIRPVIIFVTVCTKEKKQILARKEIHELLQAVWKEARGLDCRKICHNARPCASILRSVGRGCAFLGGVGQVLEGAR